MKNADGKEKSEASLRAKNINYKLSQMDSVLLLDKYYSFQSTDKFRNQEVQVLIKLPKNKTVFLDNSLKNLWYDIENTNGIIDSEMGGKYWKMTENGLTCLNCPKIIEERIIIKNGIHVNDKDGKVNIDENGIDIKSKSGNVKIDENGIRINQKGENLKEDDED